MIYGYVHSRCYFGLGKRSKRLKLRQADAWRRGDLFHVGLRGLRVTFDTWVSAMAAHVEAREDGTPR